MSGRRKLAIAILWIEGVILLAFVFFNILTFANPPFHDDISNKITIMALLGLDVFLLPIGFWILRKTVRLLTLLR